MKKEKIKHLLDEFSEKIIEISKRYCSDDANEKITWVDLVQECDENIDRYTDEILTKILEESEKIKKIHEYINKLKESLE